MSEDNYRLLNPQFIYICGDQSELNEERDEEGLPQTILDLHFDAIEPAWLPEALTDSIGLAASGLSHAVDLIEDNHTLFNNHIVLIRNFVLNEYTLKDAGELLRIIQIIGYVVGRKGSIIKFCLVHPMCYGLNE